MQTWAQVFTRALGADVSFRDVTIRIPDRGCDQGHEWRHAPEAWAEIWEKLLSWALPRRKKVDFRSLAEALWQVSHVVGGGDGKVSIERWYLSPYVEKHFNSKVTKSFVPELRSRKCFSCFRIPMFYVYMLWTFCVHFTYSCLTMLQDDFFIFWKWPWGDINDLHNLLCFYPWPGPKKCYSKGMHRKEVTHSNGQ